MTQSIRGCSQNLNHEEAADEAAAKRLPWSDDDDDETVPIVLCSSMSPTINLHNFPSYLIDTLICYSVSIIL